MKKVATSLGGLKRGFLSLSLDGLLLEQRLTFPAAVLIGLGTLVSMGVLGSIVLNALSAPYVPWVAIVSKVSLIAAFVVPPIAVWRTRQFKRRFATCEIGEVTLRNRVFEFVFRDASPSGGPPADFLEPTPTASLQGGLRAKARLRFTVHSKADTHSLARALRDCGFVVGENIPEAEVEFSRQLAVVTPTAWVTRLLVGMNVLAFIATSLVAGGIFSVSTSDLITSGADFGPLTMTSLQMWRLLTCCFVHIGLLHLLFNMYALYQAGTAAERLFGNGTFLGLYLACGVGGSLVSVWWNPMRVSAGASGAIFGIYGALLGYLARERKGIPRNVAQELAKGAVVVIAWSVVYGLNNAFKDGLESIQSIQQSSQSPRSGGPRIDQAAHIGGLILGCVFGFLAARPLEPEPRRQLFQKRTAAWAVGAALSFVLLGLLAQNSVSRSPEMPAQLGVMYFNGIGVGTNFEKAILWAQRGASNGSAESQRLLGVAYYLGRGAPQDRNLASEWFTKAADQGDVLAEKALAAVYAEDKEPLKFSDATQRRLRRLADGGDQSARTALGHREIARMQQISGQVSNSLRTNWSQLTTNQDAMADQVQSLQQVIHQGAKESTGQQKQFLEATSVIMARTLKVSQRLQGSCELLDKAMDFKGVQTAAALQARATHLTRAIKEMEEPRQFFGNYLKSYEEGLNQFQVDPRVTRVVLQSTGPRLEVYQKSMVQVFVAFDDASTNLRNLHGFLKQNWGAWKADTNGMFRFDTVDLRQQFVRHNDKLTASLGKMQKAGQQVQSINPFTPASAGVEQGPR